MKSKHPIMRADWILNLYLNQVKQLEIDFLGVVFQGPYDTYIAIKPGLPPTENILYTPS
jgi:hypothetical protein